MGANSGFGRSLLSAASQVSCILDFIVIYRRDEARVQLDQFVTNHRLQLSLTHLPILDFLNGNIPRDIDYFLFFGWPNLGDYDSSAELKEWELLYCRLLDLVATTGDVTILFLGSCLEYGIREGAIRATDLCQPNTAYGLSKAKCGDVIQRLGIKCFHFRLFYPWSDFKQRETLRSKFKEMLVTENKIITVAPDDQKRDFFNGDSFSTEMVAMIQKSFKPEGYQVFNVGSGESRSAKDLIKLWLGECDLKYVVRHDASTLVANTGQDFWAAEDDNLVKIRVN